MSTGTLQQEPIEVCVLKLSSLPHGARLRASSINARMQVLAAEERLLEQSQAVSDVFDRVWHSSPFGAEPEVVDAIIVIDDLVRNPTTEPQYERSNGWCWTWFSHMYGWAVNLLRKAEQFEGPIVVVRPLHTVWTENALPFSHLVSSDRGVAFMHFHMGTTLNAVEQAVALLRRNSKDAA